MKEPAYTIDANDGKIPNIYTSIKMNHYLYIDGRMNSLNLGNNELEDRSLHVSVEYLTVKNNVVIFKVEFCNRSVNNQQIKMFVENYTQAESEHFAFISPKQDVLFLTDEKGLYLSSGIFNEKSICQYGILNSREKLDRLLNGRIPFRPVGQGNIAGVYSLERQLSPGESASAYTWTLSSPIKSEKDLINRDKRLKSALAFFDKR